MQDVNIKILFKASFILNFKWKALKITLKTVTVSVLRVHYSRKILKKEKKPDANRDG